MIGNAPELLPLGSLKKNEGAIIVKIGNAQTPLALIHRLMELGFLIGASVEIVQEAPFFRDPIAIRVRGALIGLRRQEANLIQVSRR